MKVFHCDRCEQLLFFENTSCVQCGAGVGYLPDTREMAAFSAGNAGDPDKTSTPALRRCRNYRDADICNWLIADDDPGELCRSCRLTRVIPDLAGSDRRAQWYRLESAKRRLLFTLLALGLPTSGKAGTADAGLTFEFKADPEDPALPRIMTGHADGVITVNLAEADDAERERRRQGLGEPYRTLVGHMRHESGHYFWDRLIAGSSALEKFRALFGDERSDYQQALAAHYEQGAPADWPSRFVSAYASSHPWEDWAESWAHYLHMADTVETAADSGLVLKPRRADEPALPKAPVAAAGALPFDQMIASWFPLTYVLNNLNRGLGLPDAYPFVLSDPAIAKLRFVHDTIARASRCSE